MGSIVLLPTAPAPPPPGAPVALADIERETASRLGPFYDLVASGGTSVAVVVAGLRTNADLGGFEGLYLLRRGALRANDRVRTVERFDGPAGAIVVDFPYEDTPAAGERVELHHLHPELQLFPDVQAALRRCYLLDVLEVTPPPDAPAGPAGTTLDLTAQAPWLYAPRQVLAVARDGVLLPAARRYGEGGGTGYQCYASRGHLYLTVPPGAATAGLSVRAYRDAFGLVDGVDAPGGPQHDADQLAVPLDYVCAFAHIEAWRRHRDRMEAAAAEGRFPAQAEVAAEATRVAAIYADFLFRPATERGDRPAPPAPIGTTGELGGSGALAGAVVNQNDPYD